MKHRVGDTLIEVTLAIGIFSMVAIAVVAVMTSGTSNAQTSLETTLTREEIDTQAEALRFIHSAYMTDTSSATNPYLSLWSKIAARAINPKTDGTDYLDYSPKTCKAALSSSIVAKYGFVINSRLLGTDPANSYIQYNSSIFKEASTYPRLIYSSAEASGTDSLVGGSTENNLYRAEGIYVIAVKDNDTTQIVDDKQPAKGTGFYDFYIRSCWYGTGSDTPSTISTVIRLYNPPDATDRYTDPTIQVNYYANGGTGSMTPTVLKPGSPLLDAGKNFTPTNGFTNPGLTQLGWNTKADGSGYGTRKDGACRAGGNITCITGNIKYRVPDKLTSFQVLDLYAIWDRFRIDYNVNNASGDTVSSVATSYCDSLDNCYVSNTKPTRSDSHGGFSFKGWAKSKTATSPDFASGAKIRPTSSATILYAVWERYKIDYNANGGSYAPNATYCPTKVGCVLSRDEPSRSGYRFKGWSTSSSATAATYASGSAITPSSTNTILYAVWESNNETITIKLTWSRSPSDLDSHVEGQKSNNTNFHAYYGAKVGSDVDGTTIASLDRDVTSGYGPETFTLNTLGGRNYYYYVHNFSGNGKFSNGTVTITSPSLGTITYSSNNATGSGRYWNVFAYKDGRIVVKNTFSSSPDISY